LRREKKGMYPYFLTHYLKVTISVYPERIHKIDRDIPQPWEIPLIERSRQIIHILFGRHLESEREDHFVALIPILVEHRYLQTNLRPFR